MSNCKNQIADALDKFEIEGSRQTHKNKSTPHYKSVSDIGFSPIIGDLDDDSYSWESTYEKMGVPVSMDGE